MVTDDIADVSSKQTLVIMVGLLVVSVAALIARVMLVIHGHFARRVSLSTVVVAICGFALVRFVAFGPLVRVGAAFLGFGAAVSAAAYYLHAPREIQSFTGFNNLGFSVVGYLLIVIGAVQWIRMACSAHTASDDTSVA